MPENLMNCAPWSVSGVILTFDGTGVKYQSQSYQRSITVSTGLLLMVPDKAQDLAVWQLQRSP